MKNKLVGILAPLLLLALVACGGDAEEPAEESTDEPTIEQSAAAAASVSVVSPEDGATVSSPVKVQMSATGVAIEPAADGIKPNSGHFHIIIDAPCNAAGQVVPADATHLHFGKAQTEAEVPLTAGKHDLCIQVADAGHVATDLTKTISVTVS